MKKHYLFIISFFFSFAAFAQPPSRPIHFANGDFVTVNNISNQTLRKESLQAAIWGNRYYVLIQFNQLPDANTKNSLQLAGIYLESYIPDHAFFASINIDVDFSNLSRFGINTIVPVPTQYKIENGLSGYHRIADKNDIGYWVVCLFSNADKGLATTTLQSLGLQVQVDKFNLSNCLLIQPAPTAIHQIAALPFVNYIAAQSIKDKPINYNNTSTHGVSGLQSPSGRNLLGRNVTIGVGDNADITSGHIDFTGRAILRHPFGMDYHGTHTSGTAAGGGLIDPKRKGIAPKAGIISQWFSDVLLNTPTYVTDNNIVATNNSYYSVAVGCPGEGVYDALSNYIDAQMRSYDEVLHVIASGNDGSLGCTPYPQGFATVKSGWQSAKNVLTVGSMDQASYNIALYSSRGPVKDGRIKPEITSNGASYSTYPINTYGLSFGTSMAAPVVTGATALLQERYRQLHAGANAKGALVKALLCNNAEDLGNPGPDFKFGFGMLNVRKAIEAMEGNQYYTNSIANTQNQSFGITVPSGARRLRVLLVWNDYPATPNTANALVNDLDLTVTTPSVILHRPLILDSSPAGVDNAATEGIDHINNIEQVVIDNPSAGIFTVNVNGFAIPQGPQSYYVTYQIDMNGVTVEYPFGGEHFVPGETETLRWTAYGSENENFTIEYSDNNGSSWTVINNSVASTARSYVWTVPAGITNQALVRVSRNNTAYADNSDANFNILGVPVINAMTTLCEGYIQLGWSAATGATSYDVLQLKGDSMSVIGNTTTLSFNISNLNPSLTNWFAVRAKNGTVIGRQSLAESGMAASGTCNLSAFDNDFKAVSLDAPNTGRENTASAKTGIEPVKLTIKNLDDISSSGTYSLSYQINGGSIITENTSVVIPSLSTYTYTFTSTANLLTPGIYNFKVWVTRAGDTQPSDDTAYATIKQLANAALTLPSTDGFETTTIENYQSNTIGLNGDDRLDFKTEQNRSRARTFVNTGFARTGNRAITLDQTPLGAIVTDSLLLTYNLSNYISGNQLRYDFYYKNHGQAANPNNKIWMRGSDSKPWVLAYDLVANQGDLGAWKKAIININDILDTVLPVQPVSSSFQVKIVQQGSTSANVPNPILDQDDGYTFDDTRLVSATNDVAISEMVSPILNGCGSYGSVQVAVKIKNYSNTVFNNVPIAYRINGAAPVTNTITSIAANSTQVYTFPVNANLAVDNDYKFDCWLTATGDTYSNNDSILDYRVHTSPIITSYPYMEGFESSAGSWYAKGSNSSWQWGTPAKTIMNKAANGSKAFVTNLTGTYTENEFSYLYSPCFDISSLNAPVLSFSHFFEIETDYDYAWVEYSVGNSNVWNKLGAVGEGTNWYDNAGVDNWRVSNNKWHVASISLPRTAGIIRIRFVMSSDAGLNLEGIGIDDIRIHEKLAIAVVPPALTTAVMPVSGNDWIPFTWGDVLVGPYYIMGEMNPHGQNLGAVNMNLYMNPSGIVRNSSNEYYLDRNYAIRAENIPSQPVSVRLYFKDSEINALINASGCASCGKPSDAYELGITKYSGLQAEENGTLADNLAGSYQFIFPANTQIIPHGDGYYAEFSVNEFSEHWFSRAMITPVPASNCPASTISYTATGGGTYQWQENNGVGYTNISNGVNYAGATTATLQLINLPTSTTGNKYRCLVNGNPDYERTLRFNFIWNGFQSTNWMDPANWSCGALPDQYSDVVIPAGLTNYPVLSANTSVRSVTTYTGGLVNIASGIQLLIKGK